MNYLDQLPDLLDAVAQAGDPVRQTHLMLQAASILLDEAARLDKPQPDPDRDRLACFGEWTEIAKKTADHLGSAITALNVASKDLKAEAVQISEQLQSHSVEYARVAQEHEALEKQSADLRKKAAAIELLIKNYLKLKALDEQLKTQLPRTANAQEALHTLWPFLKEACEYVQTQRKLFSEELESYCSIAEAMEHENKLFGHAPGPLLEQAITVVADARKILDDLTKSLDAARSEQQEQLQKTIGRLQGRSSDAP